MYSDVTRSRGLTCLWRCATGLVGHQGDTRAERSCAAQCSGCRIGRSVPLPRRCWSGGRGRVEAHHTRSSGLMESVAGSSGIFGGARGVGTVAKFAKKFEVCGQCAPPLGCGVRELRRDAGARADGPQARRSRRCPPTVQRAAVWWDRVESTLEALHGSRPVGQGGGSRLIVMVRCRFRNHGSRRAESLERTS